MDQKYGVINEVGDLGLGFETLNESDQEALKKKKKDEDQTKKDDK